VTCALSRIVTIFFLLFAHVGLHLILPFLKMKNSLKLILFFCLTLCFIKPLFADSPLTSIDLWSVHSEEAIVKYALKNRSLDDVTLSYILDDENSVEVKMSVISAMGWEFKSSPQKSSKLLKAILNKYKLKSINQLYDKQYASLLSVYSYSLALEDYFKVDSALGYSQKAADLDSQNHILKFISLLIKSQQNFDANEWCTVSKSFDEIKEEEYFLGGVGKQFLLTALDYIDIYKSYCN